MTLAIGFTLRATSALLARAHADLPFRRDPVLAPCGRDAADGGGIIATLTHLALPVLTRVIVEIGGLTRYVRAAMLEVLSQDYIRAANARDVRACASVCDTPCETR
jgi:ABC-type dipeptide/oligopeptide/nickel transport system permease component